MPEGSESSGICLHCGETRVFPNSHWSDRQYSDKWHKANYKSAKGRTKVDTSEWTQW